MSTEGSANEKAKKADSLRSQPKGPNTTNEDAAIKSIYTSPSRKTISKDILRRLEKERLALHMALKQDPADFDAQAEARLKKLSDVTKENDQLKQGLLEKRKLVEVLRQKKALGQGDLEALKDGFARLIVDKRSAMDTVNDLNEGTKAIQEKITVDDDKEETDEELQPALEEPEAADDEMEFNPMVAAAFDSDTEDESD